MDHAHKHEQKGLFGKWASQLREIILGGQDGLVNVLGVVLVVAGATSDARTILIAGLAATFAESISMGAVAYTSTRAATDYISSVLRVERRELEKKPRHGKKEIRRIYARKGFKGTLLNRVVNTITQNKKVWLNTLITEELHMCPEEYKNPVWAGFVVLVSAVVGSLIPLMPFFFLPVSASVWASLSVSATVLFVTGAVKAKLTVGDWLKSGVELAVIGMAAALLGYAIGMFLGVTI